VVLFGQAERQTKHIAGWYEKRDVKSGEAERHAWATLNKETGGGKMPGLGRGMAVHTSPSPKGGRLAGRASASRSAVERSSSAKKAAATRKRNAGAH
jgi:hypothetical protein